MSQKKKRKKKSTAEPPWQPPLGATRGGCSPEATSKPPMTRGGSAAKPLRSHPGWLRSRSQRRGCGSREWLRDGFSHFLGHKYDRLHQRTHGLILEEKKTKTKGETEKVACQAQKDVAAGTVFHQSKSGQNHLGLSPKRLTLRKPLLTSKAGHVELVERMISDTF